ncbi:jg22333 [Pararge aegeria aegeria]|uniref:Jg22333 protein n=1 Tax=Pararge aegeria aegeria TaxID=348720 RepID=A0A8S4S0V7_9NEOP|nr:jg22333 [Pararge aegeria aegeria]
MVHYMARFSPQNWKSPSPPPFPSADWWTSHAFENIKENCQAASPPERSEAAELRNGLMRREVAYCVCPPERSEAAERSEKVIRSGVAVLAKCRARHQMTVSPLRFPAHDSPPRFPAPLTGFI